MTTARSYTSGAVVLLKEDDGDGAYAAALRARAPQLAVAHAPAIACEPVAEAAASLRALLPRLHATHAAVVLTSVRAAAALAGAADAVRGGAATAASAAELDARLSALPVYCVGRRTRAALGPGFARVLGAHAGSAAELAGAILADLPAAVAAAGGTAARPLLFLAGDQRLDALPARLAAAGVALQELVVYRTVPLAGARVWAAVLRAAPPPGGVLCVVVFSPSGLGALLAHAPARAALVAGGVDVAAAAAAAAGAAAPAAPSGAAARVQLRLVALGATTAAAVRTAGLPLEPAAVCDTPDAAGVASAVARALAMHGGGGAPAGEPRGDSGATAACGSVAV